MKKPYKHPFGSYLWFHEVEDRHEEEFWAKRALEKAEKAKPPAKPSAEPKKA